MDNPNESIAPTKLKGQRVARDTHCRTIPILWFGSKQLCMDYNVPLSRSLLTYIILRGSQKVYWTMLKRLFVTVCICSYLLGWHNKNTCLILTFWNLFPNQYKAWSSTIQKGKAAPFGSGNPEDGKSRIFEKAGMESNTWIFRYVIVSIWCTKKVNYIPYRSVMKLPTQRMQNQPTLP